MSSKGELKKRNGAIKLEPRQYHWSEIHDIQNDFDRWIDEAKKEIGQELYSVATIWDFNKVVKVFEKWFGKSLPEKVEGRFVGEAEK